MMIVTHVIEEDDALAAGTATSFVTAGAVPPASVAEAAAAVVIAAAYAYASAPGTACALVGSSAWTFERVGVQEMVKIRWKGSY
mmetsp:Transcript_3212/g.9823  ORF Transcript_3212/g.9823 Transcript_3212/m.9823 type:complete len:84 (+) Transcript_3212:1085-1336(+)